MIVTCEACFTTFNLNDELIKPSGSKVRCSKCHKVFKVFPFVPEDVSPPLPVELSDKSPEYSLSPPLFQMPTLDEPGAAVAGHSPETSALPVDFTDISEFDFSELDKLLQEDNKDKSGGAFSNLQEDQLREASFLSSGEPAGPLDFSEASDKAVEPDLFEISLDLPEIKDGQDEPSSDLETPDLIETEDSDLLSDKTDETFNQGLSDISFDESFDLDEDQVPGVNLETETKLDFFEPKPQDLSLDDFEKTLEMDFSDISLVSTAELNTAADQKKEAADSEIKTDQASEDEPFSEDTLIGFNDIETLDLSDIESLIEKQEVDASAINDGDENFQRAESVIFPLPASSKETDETLEMEEQYLIFDELQLDKDDSESATLLEIKESFQPHLSEIPEPPAEPVLQPETFSLDDVSEDKEMNSSIGADIDEEQNDTRPAQKKGISPLILVALIIAVIAAVSYGGYMLLNSMGIPIPFISQQAPSKVSDPGNINIKSFDISSKFVDNVKIGKLFVITGKVKNEYPTARGSIQIAGKLYSKDKALVKTETVFCGNILSDLDLANADATTLQQRLQNRSGDNRINQKVSPGATIPFMLVFFNLPTNLEEFTTEIISSVAS
ncbi:MAG: DUF3426 domain-containing protein [Desulfatirhabdiaceae bacterium]|nr:DUF3426 domain-containing protein [Desulfatirhabdiaceae bacterium]